jgi:hypothetical protein
MSAPKPPAPKPAPVPAPPQVEEAEKDKLYTNIATIVGKLIPKQEKGALKKLTDALLKAIQNAGITQVKAVAEEFNKAIVALQNKEGTIEELFIKKLDDWAIKLNADPMVVQGLRLLGSDNTLDFLGKMVEGWNNYQKGETHITMHYRTFVLGWLATIVGTAMVFMWIGSKIG